MRERERERERGREREREREGERERHTLANTQIYTQFSAIVIDNKVGSAFCWFCSVSACQFNSGGWIVATRNYDEHNGGE